MLMGNLQISSLGNMSNTNNNPTSPNSPQGAPEPSERSFSPDNVTSYQPPGHVYAVAGPEGEYYNPVPVYSYRSQPLYAQVAAETLPSGNIMSIPELKRAEDWRPFLYRFKAYACMQDMEEVLTQETPTNPEELKEWKPKNSKLLGVLRSRTSMALETLIKGTIKETITEFEMAFGQSATARIVNLYTEIHLTTFPPNSDPLPIVTKMDQIRKELDTNDVKIPEALFVLIVMSKLGNHWEMFKQKWTQEDKKNLTVTKLIASLTAEWHRRKGAHEAAYATHITGINRFQPKSSPPWSHQNRQSGGSSNQKKNYNKSGYGNGNNQNQTQNQGN